VEEYLAKEANSKSPYSNDDLTAIKERVTRIMKINSSDGKNTKFET
jgi:hypothetical protein